MKRKGSQRKEITLAWHHSIKKDAIGSGYGYRVHNAELFKEVSKLALIDDQTAEDYVSITCVELFRRVFGKVNWLFTMFEGFPLPVVFHEALPTADRILVPSNWVKRLFQWELPDLDYTVIPHGISSDFSPKRRRKPSTKPFRFLWLGSTDERKGWKALVYAWEKFGLKDLDSVELYLKTTAPKGELIPKKGNIILDNRNISRGALVRLYHSAHCFVFPTMGEGFGLTLAEAMRTGLPSIATDYSGHTDFFDESVGYPVGHSLTTGTAHFIGRPITAEINIALPYTEQLASRMYQVLDDYDKALHLGWKGALRIMQNYTWEKSARLLVDTIKEDREKRRLLKNGTYN